MLFLLQQLSLLSFKQLDLLIYDLTKTFSADEKHLGYNCFMQAETSGMEEFQKLTELLHSIWTTSSGLLCCQFSPACFCPPGQYLDSIHLPFLPQLLWQPFQEEKKRPHFQNLVFFLASLKAKQLYRSRTSHFLIAYIHLGLQTKRNISRKECTQPFVHPEKGQKQHSRKFSQKAELQRLQRGRIITAILEFWLLISQRQISTVSECVSMGF